MRDLMVVLADQEMSAVVTALLRRRAPSLGIRPLDFDPEEDIFRDAAGKDSGCYLRGATFLAPKRKTHRHGLVILDEQWGGTPGWRSIEKKVSDELAPVWGDDAEVIVIAPELEVWAFVASDHLATALRWPDKNGPLREWLARRGAWPAERAKPPDPKAALAECARQGQVRINPQWFGEFAGGPVGLSKCIDPAFLKLVAALRRWFPAG